MMRSPTPTPLRTRVAALLIALVSVTTVSSARADEPKPWHIGVTPSQRAEAQRHLDQANDLLRNGLFAPGVARLQQALMSWDHPGIHFNLAKGLMNIGSSNDALLHFWRSLRFGAEGIGPDASEQAVRYTKILMSVELVHIVVVSHQPGRLRLGDREIMNGPGRWEGVVLAGRIDLEASGSERVWSRDVKAGNRVQVVWPIKGEPATSIREQDPGDQPDLMRATLGYVVAFPTDEDISKAKPMRYRIDDVAQALLAPFGRNPEARHLCKGATGELLPLCRAYDADLTYLETRWKEASSGWEKVWRRYRDMTVGALLDYLH
jgi:hypothetical protein